MTYYISCDFKYESKVQTGPPLEPEAADTSTDFYVGETKSSGPGPFDFHVEVVNVHRFFKAQTVFIALDGPAAQNKIVKQREHNRLEEVKCDPIRLGLTPGARVMKQLSTILSTHLAKICELLESLNYRSKCEFSFSGPSVPGEATHKIEAEIKKNAMKRGDHELKHRHCVAGLDGNYLGLMLIANPDVRNLAVWIRPGKRGQGTYF